MTFLELAVRGIRHFSGFTRIPFRPGLNMVWGGNQSGKTTLWQVLRVLLVADRKAAATDDARQWGHAALTFQGDDGHSYCLARRFPERSQRLARHEPGEGFVPVELANGDRGPVDPQPGGEPSLWSVCLGGASWLPSARLRGMPHGPLPTDGLPPHPPAAASASLDLVPVPADTRRAAAEQRLKALRKVERMARKAADLELEMASCYDRRALLAARLDAVGRVDAEREHAERELESVAEAAHISERLAHDARAYRDALATCRRQKGTLEMDLADLTLDLEAVRRIRVERHPGTYAAMLLGATGALVLRLAGWGPPVYGILGAGAVLAGFVAYRTAATTQRRRNLRQRIATLRDEMAALDDGLAEAYAPLLRDLAARGIPSVERFLEARERHGALKERIARLETRLADLLDGSTYPAMERELTRLERRIEDLEETLGAMRVTGLDAEAARREHDHLEAQLGGVPGPEGTSVDISIEPHLVAHPALRTALDRRKETYCARAGDYLSRFTGGEFTGLTVNGTYHPTLITERPDRSDGANAGRPGAGMVDLIYLAQYLALIETLDPTGLFPLVLDEPFLSLDPERRTVLYETLREAARHRQVVVFTCQQFLTSPGDHLVRLKG
jgi:hypothetical protein